MAVAELTREQQRKWKGTVERGLKNLLKQNPRNQRAYKRVIKDLESDELRNHFSTPELILYCELKRIGLPVEHHWRRGNREMDLFIDFFKLGYFGGIDIECDGAPWHHTPAAIARDKKRDKELARSGILTLRIDNVDIENRVLDVGRLVIRAFRAVDGNPKILSRPRSIERITSMVMSRGREYNLDRD